MNEEIKKVENVNNLIPVFAGEMQGRTIHMCSARDLHTFLQVGKNFSNWIKNRLETYGFIEGEDFTPILAQTSQDSKGGRPVIEYHLTLDTAKEMAMVERNEQGKLARRYFIECEKNMLKNASQLPHEIEKACDYTSWRLSNDYQHHTMALLGNAAQPNDDEVIGHVAFLVKRRLYDELTSVALEMLHKKVPESEVADWILTWNQAGQQKFSSMLC